MCMGVQGCEDKNPFLRNAVVLDVWTAVWAKGPKRDPPVHSLLNSDTRKHMTCKEEI